jgi:hypothetical protein
MSHVTVYELERARATGNDPESLRRKIEQYAAEIERLRAALAFYARPIAYQGDNIRNEGQDPFTPPDKAYILSIGRDGGEVARRALGEQATAKSEEPK